MDASIESRTARPLVGADDRDEPGLNMTPMIDIVFQLLIFFLLSLRFKSVDRRIESEMPREVGTRPLVAQTPPPRLVVKLFRKNAERADRAFTRVRVGNRHTIDLPTTPRGEAIEADDVRDAALERVIAAIHDVRRRGGFDPDVKGEIRAPLPEGQAVPHADVIAVLDAFLRAEFEDVAFAGAPLPLPGR